MNTEVNKEDTLATEVKKKRPICSRCHRPTPQACICEALPDSPISLEKCELVILQHPHEVRRKNRSLPLVELCVDEQDMHTVVARQFGDQLDPSIMGLLQGNVMLVYPSEDAVSLTEGFKQTRERQTENDKITVILLDATWKYAREMHKANESANRYPTNLIRVKLTRDDWNVFAENSEFKPARFDIRKPPSPDHLSTAESIAWVVSVMEGNSTCYDVIMKPLDLMVKKWRSFSNKGSFSFMNGDGNIDEAAREKATKGRKRKKGGA